MLLEHDIPIAIEIEAFRCASYSFHGITKSRRF